MVLLRMCVGDGIRCVHLFVCRIGNWWTLRSFESVVDVFVKFASMYIGHFKYTSNGLGGSDGVFQSLRYKPEARQSSKCKILTILPIFMLLLFTLNEIYIHFSYSIIIQTQRNCELFKLIKYSNSRRHSVVQKHNTGFIVFCSKIFFICVSVTTLWVIFLILQAGDVHTNPGPDSVESDALSSVSSICSLETFQNLFTILHLNVQSLTPKIDLVRAESDAYDVMILTESWLKPNIPDDSILIQTSIVHFDTTGQTVSGVALQCTYVARSNASVERT